MTSPQPSYTLKPSYTLIRNRMVPSGPITAFKWFLVIMSLGLFVGAIVSGRLGDSAWQVFGIITFLGSFGVFKWALKIAHFPTSTDASLPRRVDLYRQLKDHAWAPTVTGMRARLEYVRVSRRFLATPWTWKRKQGILHGTDGALDITLYEHNGVVGKVKLELRGTFLGP